MINKIINKIKSLFIKKPNINITKTHLTLTEMSEFINMVVEMCFVQDVEGDDIDYSPIWKEITILNCFADYYTDYKATDDIEANYLIYKDLNPWKSNIDQEQFVSMIVAIDEMIEFRRDKLLQSQTPLAELIGEITKIVKGLGDNFDMDAIGGLVDTLDDLGKIDVSNIVGVLKSQQKLEPQNKGNVE